MYTFECKVKVPTTQIAWKDKSNDKLTVTVTGNIAMCLEFKIRDKTNIGKAKVPIH